jgi:macrolide-specific efflux system membrane fusion protein
MKIRSKLKKRYAIAAIIIFVALIAVWKTLNAPEPIYQTLIVRPGELQQSVLATGKLDALRKVDVGAQVSGQLKTLSVEIGDKVKKGQLLGVIDPEQAENQIKEVEATLMELRAQRGQAEAERKLAQVTLARQQQLAKTQAISRQDLDTSATQLAVKQAQIGTIDAQIKRNQATLDSAKTNLDYTRIVAPMAGEVTQITTLQGQTVIAAQQAPNILTLADMGTMLVKAQVSEADVIHLKPGQKAWFTVLGDPQTRYEGVLKDILPTPEKVNDAIFYHARFEVPNPKGVLRLEMTAQVHIQLTGEKNVLTIPLAALGESSGDNRYKVKVLRNGETRDREISLGSRNDTDVVVVKGLEEGNVDVIRTGEVGAVCRAEETKSVLQYLQHTVAKDIFAFEPEQFQALNPFWIMVGSPILAAIYNKMGDRLPMPHKFAIGMVLCSGAFLVLPLGAKFASDAGIVSVNWLILSYALQSVGELMISGLGLAMVAQLVPQRLMGFIMGSWFLTTAGAAIIAGKIASLMAVPENVTDPLLSLNVYGSVFLQIGIATAVIAALMLLTAPKLNRMTQDDDTTAKATNTATA